jgi:hypothetical protein
MTCLNTPSPLLKSRVSFARTQDTLSQAPAPAPAPAPSLRSRLSGQSVRADRGQKSMSPVSDAALSGVWKLPLASGAGAFLPPALVYTAMRVAI